MQPDYKYVSIERAHQYFLDATFEAEQIEDTDAYAILWASVQELSGVEQLEILLHFMQVN